MNAAAYIRVSTDDQIEFSPASQLNQLRIYAQNHQLLLLDSHIYMDAPDIIGLKQNPTKRASL